MIIQFDNTETDIGVLGKSIEKFKKCKHGVAFMGQKSCAAFQYTFDSSIDILHHCGSCKTNTSEPTAKKINVRFY